MEDMEPIVESTSRRTTGSFTDFGESSFIVLDQKEVHVYMTELLTMASQEVTSLNTTSLRVVLNHYNWNVEKMIEDFSSNQECLLRELHIICSSHEQRRADEESSSVAADSPILCQLCFSLVTSDKIFKMECYHCYCQSCWKKYLRQKIIEDNWECAIVCPATNCTLHVPDEMVIHFVTRLQFKDSYRNKILNSFVKNNHFITWCPVMNCSNAIIVKEVVGDGQVVTCRCGYEYCFSCSELNHLPATCSFVSMWRCLREDQSSVLLGPASMEKDCPECHAKLMKKSGINFMQCTKPSCNFIICWTCLTLVDVDVDLDVKDDFDFDIDFDDASDQNKTSHRCLKFSTISQVATSSQGLRKKMKSFQKSAKKCLSPENSKQDAQRKRLTFFLDRYYKHLNSLELERSLYDCVVAKLDQLNQGLGWVDDQYLLNTTKLLAKCRLTVMHSYVFLYFLKINTRFKNLETYIQWFEFNTERLSFFLNQVGSSQENTEILKYKVIRAVRKCELGLKKILSEVSCGYTGDWWVINPA